MKIAFHPLRDFSYTSLVSIVPLALSVQPSVPARSVKEFIALAKARPAGNVSASAALDGTRMPDSQAELRRGACRIRRDLRQSQAVRVPE